MTAAAAPLIFLHLPKTAGTTFDAVLSRQFRPEQIHMLRSERWLETLAAFPSLPLAQREAIRLLKGHQPFGLHVHLAPGARYLTVLRDPVARVVSHYRYVVATRHPRFYPRIEAEGLDLHGYVTRHPSGELENGQTRWLSGRLDDAPLDETDLARARRHLAEHFAWVGVAERFDESLVELALRQGWPRIYYRRRNVGEPQEQPIAAATRAAILARNRLDLALHQEAVAALDAATRRRRWLRAGLVQALRLGNRLGAALRPLPA